MTAIEVRVADTPVRSLGYVGDLTWSHTWPGGCSTASWSMSGLAKGVASPLLKRGARVSVTVGGWPVWAGILTQPGASMETFEATGLASEAKRFMALDATDAITYDTGDAIARAIDDGLPWIYDGGAPTGVASDRPERLSDLLDTSATAAGLRWGVGANGRFFSLPDPTTPKYDAILGSGVLGQADDDYASHIYGWYTSAMSGTPPVASAWGLVVAGNDDAAALYGRSEQYVDLSPRGVLGSTEAQGIVNGMLAQGRARVGFTERIELADYQLLRNGSPAALALVKAGDMVRLHGAISPGQSATGSNAVDVVIAETTHEAGARTITIAPAGLAPRTLADVLSVTSIEASVA